MGGGRGSGGHDRDPGSPRTGREPPTCSPTQGWTIGALLLARRRWPVAVLAASFAILQVDYVLNYPGMSAALPLAVALLNELFSRFDGLTEARGLEKIKTIGDAYMVAGGLPDPMPDHAGAAAELALGMLELAARQRLPDGGPVRLRIGIASGPVVAGVIGRRRFSYDLWGDTVNTASRMQPSRVPGCFQVTERTRDLLGDRYLYQERGMIQVRGKGSCSPTS
jgi:class 3 adenylate cyclase